MLDSAGFMEPLRRTNQAVPDCQYLSKGRYTIINRPPTNEEDELLKRLLGVTSTKVGIYHYATVQMTKFRDISVEDKTMREKASIVQINNAICKIMYFINAITNLPLSSAMEILKNLKTASSVSLRCQDHWYMRLTMINCGSCKIMFL